MEKLMSFNEMETNSIAVISLAEFTSFHLKTITTATLYHLLKSNFDSRISLRWAAPNRELGKSYLAC